MHRNVCRIWNVRKATRACSDGQGSQNTFKYNRNASQKWLNHRSGRFKFLQTFPIRASMAEGKIWNLDFGIWRILRPGTVSERRIHYNLIYLMCLDAVRTKSNRKTFVKNFVKEKLRCNRSDNDPPTQVFPPVYCRSSQTFVTNHCLLCDTAKS